MQKGSACDGGTLSANHIANSKTGCGGRGRAKSRCICPTPPWHRSWQTLHLSLSSPCKRASMVRIAPPAGPLSANSSSRGICAHRLPLDEAHNIAQAQPVFGRANMHDFRHGHPRLKHGERARLIRHGKRVAGGVLGTPPGGAATRKGISRRQSDSFPGSHRPKAAHNPSLPRPVWRA
ncbi:MAG: hypothetical protein CM15mP21_8320 [Hyphomicrobiales bacterium]|nr:MAG: hypothetical protein CM15mP21_8320 [Hyphomicrobiales bacterium]